MVEQGKTPVGKLQFLAQSLTVAQAPQRDFSFCGEKDRRRKYSATIPSLTGAGAVSEGKYLTRDWKGISWKVFPRLRANRATLSRPFAS